MQASLAEAEDDDEESKRVKVALKRAEGRVRVLDQQLWVYTCSSSLAGVERLLRGMSGLVDFARIEAMDATPYALPTAGGMLVDLRSGDVRLRTADDLFTRELLVPYVAGTSTSRVAGFVDNMFPDPSIAAYVQRVMGYCLSGETNLRTFFLFYGETRNGKSALIGTLLGSVLSTGTRSASLYQTIARADLTVSKNSSGTVNESLAQAGANKARTAVLLETDDPTSSSAPGDMDWQLIKNVSGEDAIRPSFKHKTAVSRKLQAKILIGTNNLPSIPNSAEGDRCTYIPCTTFFCNEGRINMADPVHRAAVLGGRRRDEDRATFEYLQSPEGLKEVLAWMISGAVAFYAAGRQLPACPSLDAAKRDFLNRSNHNYQWFTHRYVVTGLPADYVLCDSVKRLFDADPREKDERGATWQP